MILLFVFITIILALAAKPTYTFLNKKFKKVSIPSELSLKLAQQVEPYQLQEIQQILLNQKVTVESEVKESALVNKPKRTRKKATSKKTSKTSKKKTSSKNKPVKKKVLKKKKSSK